MAESGLNFLSLQATFRSSIRLKEKKLKASLMKKLIFASFLFLAAGIQSIAAPRIVLEDKKENYAQTETGYNLQFKLVANAEELSSIMAEVANHADRIAMQLSEGSNGTYDCLFSVNHQNHPEYVHKMLLSIGISELEYKGQIQSLDTIVQILYSYL